MTALGLYQCPQCYGPSYDLGWCRSCLSSGVGWLCSFCGKLRHPQVCPQQMAVIIAEALNRQGNGRAEIAVNGCIVQVRAITTGQLFDFTVMEVPQ